MSFLQAWSDLGVRGGNLVKMVMVPSERDDSNNDALRVRQKTVAVPVADFEDTPELVLNNLS